MQPEIRKEMRFVGKGGRETGVTKNKVDICSEGLIYDILMNNLRHYHFN